MPMIQAGEWLPDRTNLKAPDMMTVRNLQRVADGYRSFSDAVRGVGEIPSECRGAFASRAQVGQDFKAAGTASDLYVATSGVFDEKSSSTGAYTLSDADRWNFALFGDLLVGVAGVSVVPQKYSFQPQDPLFSDLSADASFGHEVMTYNDFLVLGNIQGRGVNAAAIGRQEGALHWSAAGIPTSWPAVGTQPARDALSDFNILEGDGGPVTALAAASEYAAVFRAQQVWRMDFVGSPAVFAFRKIDNRRGCIVPSSAIAVGNLVYYIAEEGFMVFDGARVASIGHEKIDRTWRQETDFSSPSLARVSTAHDPSRRTIFWYFPASGIAYGYNYELGQWWSFVKGLEWLFTAPPLVSSLDDTSGLGNLDMDAPGTPPTALGDQDMDGLGGGSEETLEAFLKGASGNSELHVFDDTKRMQGALAFGDVDAGQRVMMRFLRPVYETPEFDQNPEISGLIGAYKNPGELQASFLTDWVEINSVGVMPLRISGRYLRAAFAIGPQINVRLFQGFDYKAMPLGER